MNPFIKNLNYLIKKDKIELVELADKLHITADKIYEMLSDRSTVEVDVLASLAKYFELSIDDLVTKDLNQLNAVRNKNIKLLLLDVDGVLTDGGMYYAENGDEFKKFNSRDGMGIKQVIKQGIQVGLISSGFNKNIIESRAELLGIQHVYAGAEPKEKIFNEWLKKLNIKDDECAYVGDDINDLALLKRVGISACPADAMRPARKACKVVLTRNGGDACVREFIDTYILKNG